MSAYIQAGVRNLRQNFQNVKKLISTRIESDKKSCRAQMPYKFPDRCEEIPNPILFVIYKQGTECSIRMNRNESKHRLNLTEDSVLINASLDSFGLKI